MESLRKRILALRKKIADFVMQAFPQKKEKDSRKVMSKYAILYGIDNELMELEAQTFLDSNQEWDDYVIKYKLPEIEGVLKTIDPNFF